MSSSHLPFDISHPIEKDILEPFLYLWRQRGKEFRSKLMNAFDAWIHVPPEKLAVIRDAIEMLHNSSLLIDDIQDNSDLRRGIPVAHKIYGVPLTINCANHVYFLALQKLLQLNCAEIVKVFTEELLLLHRGQGMELYWRDSCICPSEEEYLEMIGNKTGGLLRLAVKMMEIASGCKSDYVPLVDILGLHFQIRDDYINLHSKTYTENKGFAEDLTEGKFSFVLIHGIKHNKNESGQQIQNILRQRTKDVSVKQYAIKLLEDNGSFEYTRNYLFDIEKKALDEIARLGGNPALEGIIGFLRTEYSVPN
ncbi:geranylgeranyl pyrophosphate synthase [Polychytrium aggregatum]|uniref:geranylgeranyl pyrophosphate synthase n=1 Tax=Polychytrium aggregatum TaxID=110093 RepID=UPI0022FE540C|nr:geranylgeranyl pyrophosphate synthase [Polychytrium aggregatum]KAI9203490.1 geranylgeranyl pyrophosphate synthase [Polychytrium aggregatum]